MVDHLRKNIVTKYRSLCSKLKINNWQKEVFMSNAIEMLDKLNDRIEKLEKENEKLKQEIKKK